MKIIYITGTLPSSTEFFILNEINALLESGCKITVLSLNKPSTQTPLFKGMSVIYDTSIFNWCKLFTCIRFLITQPHQSIFLLKSGGRSFFKNLKDLFTTVYFMRCRHLYQADYIHAHFANRPADIALLLSLFINRPFGITAHAHDIYCSSRNDLAKKLNKCVQLVTCTSYNKQYLSAIVAAGDKAKIHLVYHGISIDEWTFVKKTTPACNLLTVSRLVKKKGTIYLLQALSSLQHTLPTLHLHIAGDGPETPILKTYCRQAGLENRVTFLGYIEHADLQSYYHKADILVQPSVIDVDADRDGLPNVILEAMATGTPVIASAISAIPEVITHEHTGILVPPAAPELLAQAILHLIHSPELHSRISYNARKFLEEHLSIQQSTQQLLTLFSNICCYENPDFNGA